MMQKSVSVFRVLNQSSILGHPMKYGLLVPDQLVRSVKFADAARVQDHDTTTVQDRVQPGREVKSILDLASHL